MKIETLRDIPCIINRAFAWIPCGTVCEVLQETPGGVQVTYQNHAHWLTNIAEPLDYRVYDHAARQADFVNHRAILSNTSGVITKRARSADCQSAVSQAGSLLPCGCR